MESLALMAVASLFASSGAITPYVNVHPQPIQVLIECSAPRPMWIIDADAKYD